MVRKYPVHAPQNASSMMMTNRSSMAAASVPTSSLHGKCYAAEREGSVKRAAGAVAIP